MNQVLEQIDEQANELKKVLEDQVGVVASIPSSYHLWTTSNGVLTSDVISRSEMIAGLASGIGRTPKEKALLLPSSRLNALRDGMADLVRQTSNFNEQWRNLIAAGGVRVHAALRSLPVARGV